MPPTAMRTEYVSRAWEDVACPVCGASDKRHLERFGPNLQYSHVICLRCRNVYVTPRPVYDGHFIKHAYANYHLFQENYEYKESSYNDFRREVEEIASFDAERSHVLDVGCAMGDFLHAAKKRYRAVSGVEISGKMADFASAKLGATIYNCQFETIETGDRFSCIHMSHIIEHVPDPNAWLRKAKALLDAGGILVVCVPNMNSFSRRVKRGLARLKLRDARWKDPARTPDHLFEPTIEGMRYFFARNGYDILSIYTYSRSDMDSSGWFARLFYRLLKGGSNIRVFARPTLT